MFNTLHLLRTPKILATLLFTTLIAITLIVTPAAFCASLKMEVALRQPSMSVIRFGNRPATKDRETGRYVVQSFTTTGFFTGICKAASHECNTVDFPVGGQVFSKTFDPRKSNGEKLVVLTSTIDPSNTITITHNFYSSINAFKLTDALRAYFGRLEFLKESTDECACIYTYIGDTICSASIDLSRIIAPESISAAPGTAQNLYGICVTHDREANNAYYTLTDGITKLVQKVTLQPEVTAIDDVKRIIDFGNGISLIASIYGENAYLSEERALEYEIFEVVSPT